MKMRPLIILLALAWIAGAARSSYGAQMPPEQAQLFVAARPSPVTTSRALPLQRALEAETGTPWRVLWDPITGSAVRGQGGRGRTSLLASQEQIHTSSIQFLRAHAQLLGVENLPGAAADLHHSGRAWHAVWRQRIDGRAVRGAFLNITLGDDGDVVAFRSTWLPAPTQPWSDPGWRAGLQASEAFLSQTLQVEDNQAIWAVVPYSRSYNLVPARALTLTNAFGGRWRAVVSSTGVLSLQSLLRYEVLRGSSEGDIKPLYAQDGDVTKGFNWLQVQVENDRLNTTFSNAAALWSFSLPPGEVSVRSTLEGLYAAVRNDASDPPAAFAATATIPGMLPIHFGTQQARSDERTLYYHTTLIHDWASATFDFKLMDFPLPVTAAIRNPRNGSPDYANAFWNGTGISFGNGGDRFPNFGLFADVIYHEYTHGITDFMYRPVGGLPGPLGGALHEGLSDYFACTITDEPLVGEQLAELGGAFRNLDNELLWPDDRDPDDQVHRNGEIIAGAFWDVRKILGRQIADPIIHFARELYPLNFEEYMDAILIQDDLLFGDAAAANGTPHDTEILTAFARHGMGPLGSRQVSIIHTRLGDIEAADIPRTVIADISSGSIDEMVLHWTNGDKSVQTRMEVTALGGWEAIIPGQAAGVQVNYWLEAVRLRPREQNTLPPGAPAETFAYNVGPDLEAPTIQHAAPATLPAFAWPATLGLSISDNLGVASAWMEYRRNGGPVITVGLVPLRDQPSQYRTSFPNVGGAIGDSFEYWIIAEDASVSRHVSRLPSSGSFTLQLVEILQDGFELEQGAWLHRPAVPGREDPWHISASRNHTAGGIRAWLCGNEQGTYPTNAAAELLTDWYLLGEGADASVWSWMDAEPNGPASAFDGGIVQILVEGEPFPSLLTPVGGYPRTMGDTADTNFIPPGTPCFSGTDSEWQMLQFDLSAWAGKRVQIRFVFGSDNVASFNSGWFLDDFELSAGARNPTDSSVELPLISKRLLQRSPAPNPFNPTVVFQLQTTPQTGTVFLDIIDVRGRLTRRLLAGPLSPGGHQLRWDGRDQQGREVASGVYWYRLRSSLGVEKGQLVLVR